MTCGPRITSSPVSPIGSSRVPVSRSTMRASVPGMGRPMLPTFINPPDGLMKVGSIGLPIPGTDARIVDLETGTRELPIGETGELVIRGPQVMKGYWNKPKETADVLRHDWLYTGDIARRDEDGYFYIVDRKKDLI